jgi:membrane protease YdiL (CAAX protease family)
MTAQVAKNPRIKQGWLRVLLFGLGFAIVTVLVAIPAVIGLLGANLGEIRADPQRAIANLMTTSSSLWFMVLLEALVSGITVAIFWWLIDRRPFGDLGLRTAGFWGEAVIGLFMGPALLGISALLLMLSGHLQWTDITFDGSTLFISLGLMVLIAFSEELVFRGYILKNLLETFGYPSTQKNKWIALGVSALLFAIFHLSNPGMNTLAFINLVLAGFLLGLNYIYTGNLWFSILLHFSWNFFQGPLLGFRVSGLNLPSLLQAETKGDLLLTGGDFGLEGSILNTAITLTAIVVLAWAFERKYNSRSAAGAAAMA